MLNEIPTEDLIAELLKRPFFRGVLIWQPEYSGVPNTSWRWHAQHCDAQTVCREIDQALQPAPAPELPAAETTEEPAAAG